MHGIHWFYANDATWKSNGGVTTHLHMSRKLALTPGRTSAWHHSPKERVKRSQRPGTCLRPCPALPFGLRGDESRHSLDATRLSYGGLSARRETGRRSQTAATAGSWSYRDANPTGLRPVAYGTAVTDRHYRFARIHLVCAKDATWKSNVRVTTHLTPGRTSVWHHSPKERVKRSQRPGTCLRPCPAFRITG